MYYPGQGDYIDMHTHGASPAPGIFAVEVLMAHEDRQPDNVEGLAYTAGIHPWYLTEHNKTHLLEYIKMIAPNPGLIALGEAGFDKLRGPSVKLQGEVFEQQVSIAEKTLKPVVIHCVRAWDELLSAFKSLKPVKPWLIHGFRGSKELAKQLLDRGMYISTWFEFSLRQESGELLRYLPKNRMFLETDGAEVSIRDIYKKVAVDLNLDEEKLKEVFLTNYIEFFRTNA